MKNAFKEPEQRKSGENAEKCTTKTQQLQYAMDKNGCKQ